MGLGEQSTFSCFLELCFSVFCGSGACGVASTVYKEFNLSNLGLCLLLILIIIIIILLKHSQNLCIILSKSKIVYLSGGNNFPSWFT